MDVTARGSGVLVAVPHLPESLRLEESLEIQRRLLDAAVSTHVGDEFTLWYYTPMGLPFSDHLAAAAVVYDCMDELSAFAGAPAALKTSEARAVPHGGRRLHRRPESVRSQAAPPSPRASRFRAASMSHILPRARRLSRIRRIRQRSRIRASASSA